MALNRIELFIVFHLFLLIKLFSCIVIFPFKTIENKFDNIDYNSEEYNSTHFLNEYYNKLLYTKIKIGEPSQDVNTIITFNDCNFKIGKAKKCIYTSEYLSQYNRNLSNTFNYTNYYTAQMNEFVGYKGCSAEDTIYAYTDLNLNNLSKFSQIGFYLGSDVNDSICGVMGFRMENYATFCRESNNIIKSFKSLDIISNYQWILNYTSENEGMLILGGNLSELIINFDDKKLYSTYSPIGGASFPWMAKISKIECGENNYTINSMEVNGEFDNDCSLIIGSYSYMNYIENNFFNKYKNVCFRNLINYGTDNYKFYVFECDKEKFGKNDINNFTSLSFRFRNSEYKFIFMGNDLFMETNYKFFFKIIFSFPWKDNWIFGKPFFKKFPTSIDYAKKMIYIYNNNNIEGNEVDPNKNNDDKDKNNVSGKNTYLMILLILLLISIFSVLFYFIGKNMNKLRKKKANELEDDYIYGDINNFNNS